MTSSFEKILQWPVERCFSPLTASSQFADHPRLQAQRAMGASLHAAQRPGQSTFDLSTLNLVPPPPPVVPIPITTNRDREAQLSRRVKEQEEELRTMRVENEKQVGINACFEFPLLKEKAPVESDDREIPGAVGQAQGVRKTQTRGKGSCGSASRTGPRAYR